MDQSQPRAFNQSMPENTNTSDASAYTFAVRGLGIRAHQICYRNTYRRCGSWHEQTRVGEHQYVVKFTRTYAVQMNTPL